MKMSKRIVILSALGAMMAGLILGVSVLGSIHFNFYALDNEHYRTNDNYPISEAFQNIDIETINGNVLIHSGSDSVKVTCSISEHVTYDVKSEGGTLTIKQQDSRAWYERLWMSWDALYGVVIDLPDKEYENLKVKTTSGNIDVNERNFHGADISSVSGDIQIMENTIGEMDISTVSGRIDLMNMKMDSLKVQTTSGDMDYADVRVSGETKLSSTSGNINMYVFDADKMDVWSVSGDISGRLLSGKNFRVNTVSGDISVPEADPTKGDCILGTTSGDIHVRVDDSP